MAANLSVYNFGNGGVNLVKGPLHLADDEATQLQNAELVLDEGPGGAGVLTKRGGLAVLNGSALAGSILGVVPLGLLTSYTRTMYIAKGTEDTTTWVTTTDGSTLANNSTALAHLDIVAKGADENGARDAHRAVSYRNFILYAGNSYTQGTTDPEITYFDGTTGVLVTRVPVGPAGNNEPFAITDMLTANGKVYIAVHDQGGSAPNLSGRVLSFDPQTGVKKQIGEAFGGGSGEITGGYPSCLAFYNSQLFVGLNGSSTTNGIGKIVRIYPDVGTAWTSDVSNLTSHISSLAVFSGDLYAGSQSSATTGASIYRRASTGTSWAAVATSGGGAAGDGHYASLYVHDSALYAVEYWSGGTDIVHIVRSTDGTTWATDRDVDANDGPAATPQLPGNMITLGSELFVVFRATTASANDGFIMKRDSGGAWSKLATDNYSGPLAVLVTRA